MAFAISNDEEHFEGPFETMDEALSQGTVWIGNTRPPRQPETFIDVDGMLDGIGDGDEDWSMDCADWWNGPSKEQITELQKEFEVAMSSWLDRHDLRPKWFCVEDVVRVVTTDSERL